MSIRAKPDPVSLEVKNHTQPSEHGLAQDPGIDQARTTVTELRLLLLLRVECWLDRPTNNIPYTETTSYNTTTIMMSSIFLAETKYTAIRSMHGVPVGQHTMACGEWEQPTAELEYDDGRIQARVGVESCAMRVCLGQWVRAGDGGVEMCGRQWRRMDEWAVGVEEDRLRFEDLYRHENMNESVSK